MASDLSRREPHEKPALKIACAPEYRESALQGLRRPISGTALHTGRLSEPYRCAGRTRNRLTTSYLTITAAHAFFNARLRQCPNSDSLLTAPFSSFRRCPYPYRHSDIACQAFSPRTSGNTRSSGNTPPAASKARRLTHRAISSFRHPPYRSHATSTSPRSSAWEWRRHRRRNIRPSAAKVQALRRALERLAPCLTFAFPSCFLSIRNFLGSFHPTECPPPPTGFCNI